MLTRMLKVKIQLVLISNTIMIVYEKGLHCQREISLKDGCFLKLNLNKGVKAACLKRGGIKESGEGMTCSCVTVRIPRLGAVLIPLLTRLSKAAGGLHPVNAQPQC